MIDPFSYTPHAYLEGYVDTSVVGHRLITIGGTQYTVASGYYLFRDYITAVDTAINGAGWDCERTSEGKIKLSGSSAVVRYDDSIGELLGFDRGPGVSESASTELNSRKVPRAGIPLYGATWEEVDFRSEQVFEIDRTQRGRGYAFGSASVWRWLLTMSAPDLDALRTGWCLGGKVRIIATDNTNPISATYPAGYFEGYVMGVESSRFVDELNTIVEVSLLVAG